MLLGNHVSQLETILDPSNEEEAEDDDADLDLVQPTGTFIMFLYYILYF